jgi:anhydro-N-acetylmuramic acid kinase
VDLACCRFNYVRGNWEYRLLVAKTYPYPAGLADILRDAWRLKSIEIEKLDLELGEFFAGLLNRFHTGHSLRPDLVSSHGHTLRHEPCRGITFQAGNGKIMAQKTGLTVINDFRREDVLQGGQGAPLVPVGDRLLFGHYGACLNLGGFANISCEMGTNRVAWDICPVNMALNWVASLAGRPYDRDGEIARRGRIDPLLLEHLNQLNYYGDPPPKSLGREWFMEEFIPVFRNSEHSPEDLMATITEHICLQVCAAIDTTGAEKILVTGGGALNLYLVERLTYYAKSRLHIPEKELVQFKEAIIFAFLGMLRLRGEINCLASATGGSKDLSAGIIHQPNDKS